MHYFHTNTIIRRWLNRIEAFQNPEGEWVTDTDLLKTMVRSYVETLYVELDLAADCTEIPWGLFPRLSADQVQDMLKPFTAGDVLRALKAMAPLKAPRPYGYHAYFF